MTTRYLQTLFTDSVKAAQAANGSRQAYAGRDEGAAEPDALTPEAAAFIAARDSFYLASNSESGWPYLQHRGGPIGFVKVLDARTLGFADFRGNRQYVSVGNVHVDDRTSLFFMDYPNRTRLKLLGRMRMVAPEEAPQIADALHDPAYKARIERLALIRVEAFDWNCPQHITARFTAEEMAPAIAHLEAKIAALEAQLAAKT